MPSASVTGEAENQIATGPWAAEGCAPRREIVAKMMPTPTPRTAHADACDARADKFAAPVPF